MYTGINIPPTPSNIFDSEKLKLLIECKNFVETSMKKFFPKPESTTWWNKQIPNSSKGNNILSRQAPIAVQGPAQGPVQGPVQPVVEQVPVVDPAPVPLAPVQPTVNVGDDQVVNKMVANIFQNITKNDATSPTSVQPAVADPADPENIHVQPDKDQAGTDDPTKPKETIGNEYRNLRGKQFLKMKQTVSKNESIKSAATGSFNSMTGTVKTGFNSMTGTGFKSATGTVKTGFKSATNSLESTLKQIKDANHSKVTTVANIICSSIYALTTSAALLYLSIINLKNNPSIETNSDPILTSLTSLLQFSSNDSSKLTGNILLYMVYYTRVNNTIPLQNEDACVIFCRDNQFPDKCPSIGKITSTCGNDTSIPVATCKHTFENELGNAIAIDKCNTAEKPSVSTLRPVIQYVYANLDLFTSIANERDISLQRKIYAESVALVSKLLSTSAPASAADQPKLIEEIKKIMNPPFVVFDGLQIDSSCASTSAVTPQLIENVSDMTFASIRDSCDLSATDIAPKTVAKRCEAANLESKTYTIKFEAAKPEIPLKNVIGYKTVVRTDKESHLSIKMTVSKATFDHLLASKQLNDVKTRAASAYVIANNVKYYALSDAAFSEIFGSDSVDQTILLTIVGSVAYLQRFAKSSYFVEDMYSLSRRLIHPLIESQVLDPQTFKVALAAQVSYPVDPMFDFTLMTPNKPSLLFEALVTDMSPVEFKAFQKTVGELTKSAELLHVRSKSDDEDAKKSDVFTASCLTTLVAFLTTCMGTLLIQLFVRNWNSILDPNRKDSNGKDVLDSNGNPIPLEGVEKIGKFLPYALAASFIIVFASTSMSFLKSAESERETLRQKNYADRTQALGFFRQADSAVQNATQELLNAESVYTNLSKALALNSVTSEKTKFPVARVFVRSLLCVACVAAVATLLIETKAFQMVSNVRHLNSMKNRVESYGPYTQGDADLLKDLENVSLAKYGKAFAVVASIVGAVVLAVNV